jgi:hypothetical protein
MPVGLHTVLHPVEKRAAYRLRLSQLQVGFTWQGVVGLLDLRREGWALSCRGVGADEERTTAQGAWQKPTQIEAYAETETAQISIDSIAVRGCKR